MKFLTFTLAAKNRMEQATKAFWAIQYALPGIPAEGFREFFESIVASVLDYGAPVWSHSVSLKAVEKKQQHAYRGFFCCWKKASISSFDGGYVLDANFLQTSTAKSRVLDTTNGDGRQQDC